MADLFLILSAAVIFAAGYFIMKKLDVFLNNSLPEKLPESDTAEQNGSLADMYGIGNGPGRCRTEYSSPSAACSGKSDLSACQAECGSVIAIGAEIPDLISCAVPALEYCCSFHPGIQYLLGCGSTVQLLQKLEEGTLDLVLLTGEQAVPEREDFASAKLPCTGEKHIPDRTVRACFLWNKAVLFEERDWLITALQQNKAGGYQGS